MPDEPKPIVDTSAKSEEQQEPPPSASPKTDQTGKQSLFGVMMTTAFSKLSRIFFGDKLKGGEKEGIGPTLLFLSVGIIAFLVGTLVWRVTTEPDLFSKLRDPEYARGLITFLIALATIGLCFILVVQSFTSNEGKEDERFKRSREVLTLLTGILGTIVGFYFGATQKSETDLQVPEFQIVQKTNNLRQLMTHVSGGLPPYRYNIRFEAPKGVTNVVPEKMENKLSDDGWIKVDIETAVELQSSLEVFDKNDRHKVVTTKIPAQAQSP